MTGLVVRGLRIYDARSRPADEQPTSAAVDLASGELVEAGGFYPNGAREVRISHPSGHPDRRHADSGSAACGHPDRRHADSRMGSMWTPGSASQRATPHVASLKTRYPAVHMTALQRPRQAI